MAPPTKQDNKPQPAPQKVTDTVYKKLRAVQKGMNVGKSGEGRFGAHRTAEGIIEHAKPLLDKEELALIMSNGVQEINGKNYIVAEASVVDDTGAKITVSAYAWEGELSRSLDAPQVTGSATSYARKYALGGLFAVADGKDDPDQHKEAPPPPAEKPKIATGPEKFRLQQIMKEKGMTTADEMTMFIESVINKKRVETHEEFVEVYHALTDGVDDQPEEAS